jgi:hypothetical protein
MGSYMNAIAEMFEEELRKLVADVPRGSYPADVLRRIANEMDNKPAAQDAAAANLTAGFGYSFEDHPRLANTGGDLIDAIMERGTSAKRIVGQCTSRGATHMWECSSHAEVELLTKRADFLMNEANLEALGIELYETEIQAKKRLGYSRCEDLHYGGRMLLEAGIDLDDRKACRRTEAAQGESELFLDMLIENAKWMRTSRHWDPAANKYVEYAARLHNKEEQANESIYGI